MPSTYAHRRFGADVLERLPAELQEKIAPYRELYDIGLHGPDLLFYYHAAKSTPVSALGNAMHEQPGAVFFERARGVVTKRKIETPRWPTRWASSAILRWTPPATPAWSRMSGTAA